MALGELQFRARHSTVTATVTATGIAIRGECEWLVTGSVEQVQLLRTSLREQYFEHVAAGILLLRFGNAVGKFRVGALGMLEVRCEKWGEENFERMLEEITRIASALPFSATQQAALPHDRSLAKQDDILLHAFLYARHILLSPLGDDSLLVALRAVLRDPHRKFLAERENVELDRAMRLDARTVQLLVAGAEPLGVAVGQSAQSPLAYALRGCLPERVNVGRVQHTVDTAENRFVFNFLDQLSSLIDRVEKKAREPAHAKSWMYLAKDCELMRKNLAPIMNHWLWGSLGKMTQVPWSSTVLQRQRGYKEVLRFHMTLRAAVRLPINENEVLDNLLGMKDIASLYELWCYFMVLKSVEQTLGPPDKVDRPSRDDSQVDIPWGFCASWGKRVHLYYNLSFGTAQATPPWRRSTSLPMRPDIVLRVRDQSSDRLHVLDAKFRLERHPIDNSEASTNETLYFKRDDLNKMHTYRDALPFVRSAFILYPGTVVRRYPAQDMVAMQHDAVGAIPLVPGDQPWALDFHVKSLLE